MSVPIEKAYALAKEQFAEWGVDTQRALDQLATVSLSLQCWQGDDVAGFDHDGGLSGGILATGNYLGRATTPEELRQDLQLAYRLLPGQHRLNLHAMYLETEGEKVDRDAIEPRHFQRWMAWAKEHGLAMDFNPTFFSHPRAADGFTLAHPDAAVRSFWVNHGKACRRIGEAMGAALGSPCITNVWIPDGYKDVTIDRSAPRRRLRQSLDEIFSDPIDPTLQLDAVEAKLFGIGSESYVVGSHEFYLSYAVQNQKVLCLDSGHFHPTESIADKISSVLQFVDQVLLHISRGVRWDSDHVVLLSDDVRSIAEEVVRGGFLPRVHVGLDFFDASINRIAAWVIGSRAVLQAFMIALLEPTERLKKIETAFDYTSRLSMLEGLKAMPYGAVWNYYCTTQNVPVGMAWLDEVRTYEKQVLAKR